MIITMRAEAGPSIGAGHFYRLLSVAEAARSRGHECIFDPSFLPVSLCDKARTYGFMVDNPSDDVMPDWIVLDGYGFGKEEQHAARFEAKHVMAFHEGHKQKEYPPDIIINPNLEAKEEDYPPPHPDQKIVTGLSYWPLRPYFYPENLPKKYKRKGVLVVLGGADVTNSSAAITQRLAHVGHHVTLVQGAVAAAGVSFGAGVKVMRDVENMAELYAAHEYVVTTAGSTVYEAVLCEAQTIVLYLDRVQKRMAEAVQNFGLVRQISAIEAFTPDLLQIQTEPPTLPKTYGLDGQGAMRCVRLMEEVC